MGPSCGAESRGALPKFGAPGAQSFFQYDAMLGFGAPPVLGGPALQRFDDILGNVSDKELRHDPLRYWEIDIIR